MQSFQMNMSLLSLLVVLFSCSAIRQDVDVSAASPVTAAKDAIDAIVNTDASVDAKLDEIAPLLEKLKNDLAAHNFINHVEDLEGMARCCFEHKASAVVPTATEMKKKVKELEDNKAAALYNQDKTICALSKDAPNVDQQLYEHDVLHETVHALFHDTFQTSPHVEACGGWPTFMEGMTEFWTQKICARLGVPSFADIRYKKYVDVVTSLHEAVGEQVMFDSFWKDRGLQKMVNAMAVNWKKRTGEVDTKVKAFWKSDVHAPDSPTDAESCLSEILRDGQCGLYPSRDPCNKIDGNVKLNWNRMLSMVKAGIFNAV